jgi:hypothetical protein
LLSCCHQHRRVPGNRQRHNHRPLSPCLSSCTAMQLLSHCARLDHDCSLGPQLAAPKPKPRLHADSARGDTSHGSRHEQGKHERQQHDMAGTSAVW